MKNPILKYYRPKKILSGAIIGSVVGLVIILIYSLGLMGTPDRKGFDLIMRNFSESEEASDDIALIIIDQKSLDYHKQEDGLKWPWPRAMYSYIIDFCMRGGAKAVIFDFYYSEESRLGIDDDKAFAEKAKEYGNVYIASMLEKKESSLKEKELEKKYIKKFSLPVKDSSDINFSEYKSTSLPVKVLMENVKGVGNVNIKADPDAPVRRFPTISKLNDKYVPSLPLLVYLDLKGEREIEILSSNEIKVGGTRIPVTSEGDLLIKYYGGEGAYKRYSFCNIAASESAIKFKEAGNEPEHPPKFSPEIFKDKIVLVGSNAQGLLDLRATPFSPVYPGVEINATVLDNLMNNDILSRPKYFVRLIIMFLLCVFVGIVVRYFNRIYKTILVVLVIAVGYIGLAVLLFIHSNIFLDVATVEFGILLTFTQATVVNYFLESLEKAKTRNIFECYLHPDVVERILESPDDFELQGEERELTVFFSDIANFTTISEQLRAKELVIILNDYLSDMSNVIFSYNGTIDKFIGDAIMAFWNAPLDQPDHAKLACSAALDFQKKCDEFMTKKRERGIPNFFSRIGIHTGVARVGNLGSKKKLSYSAIGDNVNLASRLEGANKSYDTSILISEVTYKLVKDFFEFREIDYIQVKGKLEPIKVFELVSKKGELDKQTKNALELFNEALGNYRKREWKKAMGIFNDVLKIKKDDTPSEIYVKRCEDFISSPPKDGWTGITVMKTK